MTETPHHESQEFEGSTVDEAVTAALQDLGVSREQVEIAVVDEGSRGFLGLGSRPARVRVSSGTREVITVRELTERILALMGVEGQVEVARQKQLVTVSITSGDADGLLIGRKGETLAALQHVVTRMASRQLDGRIGQIRVDVAGYRDRRDGQLRELAQTLAERVERTGRRAMTEPLPPAERRAVHRALESRPGVETHAAGSGLNKRVVLIPSRRRGDAAAS